MAQIRSAGMSAMRSRSGEEQTWLGHRQSVDIDPKRHFATTNYCIKIGSFVKSGINIFIQLTVASSGLKSWRRSKYLRDLKHGLRCTISISKRAIFSLRHGRRLHLVCRCDRSIPSGDPLSASYRHDRRSAQNPHKKS